MRLMRYNLVAEYVPGKNLIVTDALSPSSISDADTRHKVNNLETDVSVHVDTVRVSWNVTDKKLVELKHATEKDIQLSAVLRYVREGWPEYKADVILAAREYYPLKDELSEYEGLVTRGNRIVIPWSVRSYVLDRIHDGHQGIVKCRERANESVWWPGMSQDIKDLVGKCKHCLERRPTQSSEPLITSQLPDYPFQKVGVDLCELEGQNYIVLVDYYSRFIDVAKVGKITSEVVIKQLKGMFGRYGIPEIVISDNGRQFSSSEFQSFATLWGFSHVTSSPHYAQSNGAAERAVQEAKKFLRQKDYDLALLTYRATPIPSLGYSPAELAFGRKLRTTMPTLPERLIPNTPEAMAVKDNDHFAKQQQKLYYDRRHGAKPLSTLQPGDSVLVKHDGEKSWKVPATVTGPCAPRSYTVQTESGALLRRNRRHLMASEAASSVDAPADQAPTATQQPAAHPEPTDTRDDSGDTTSSSPVVPQPGQQTNETAGTTRSGRHVRTPVRFKDYVV